LIAPPKVEQELSVNRVSKILTHEMSGTVLETVIAPPGETAKLLEIVEYVITAKESSIRIAPPPGKEFLTFESRITLFKVIALPVIVIAEL